jgi:hypothetical protein
MSFFSENKLEKCDFKDHLLFELDRNKWLPEEGAQNYLIRRHPLRMNSYYSVFL